jgi:DNA-binding NarL/FixJ family response regulator
MFRRGLTEAAIARKLGLARSTVWHHLTRAGADLKAQRAEANPRRRVAFAAAWNAAADLGAAAKARRAVRAGRAIPGQLAAASRL